MKKKLLFITTLSFSVFTYSQTGINTFAPQATLEVKAKETDNTTAEGIIAPRLTGDQILGKDAQYGANQTGTIIYATSAVTTPSGTKTTNITKPGYYYFDGSEWMNLSAEAVQTWQTNSNSGSIELATLSDGTTPRPAKTEFIITDSGRVGVGTSNPTSKLHIMADANNGNEDMISLGNNNGVFSIGRQSNHATFNMGGGGRIIMESDVLINPSKKIIMSGNATLASANQRPGFRIDEINGGSGNTRIAKIVIGESTTPEIAPFNVTLPSRNAGSANGANLLGANIKQTIEANNDNQKLIAVDINPTFNDNSNSDIKHYGLLVRSGNVGIGTNDPAVKLDVNGEIKIGTISAPTGGVPAHAADAGTILFQNGHFYGNIDGTATGWKQLD